MKTKIISTLKKELLIIELPENGYYEEYRDGIEVRDFLTDEVLTLADYTLLGKPDEIKEEDARELVESPIDKWGDDKFRFLDYRYDGCYDLFTATESLLSVLESEIYWDVNPIDIKGQTFSNEHENKWQQAQEKTFDKNRTLIFVKN